MLDYIRNLRRLVGNTKIIVPGVRAIILDESGDLLLEKQALFGSWALPHGCVDVGESALDALKREVYEETGISVVRAEAFGLYSDPRYSVTYPNGDQVQTFTIAFLVQEWRGVLRPDGGEVTDLAFFPLDKLPEPLYPIHVETIEDWRDGRHRNGRFITK